MKTNKRHFKTLGIFLLCTVTLGSISVISAHNFINSSKEVDAADASTYYSSINASSADKLYNSLVNLESSGGTGSYADLWDIYKTAYKKSNGKIKDYYSDTTSFTPGTDQCGNYQGEGGCYNREHSIPKSWWGGSESNQGADPFIVIPSDGWVNSMRSNYVLGEVTNVTKTSTGCKYGTGKLGSLSNITCFEPMDSVKGDLARIVFYSRVRWPNVPMNEGDGSKVFSGSQTSNYGLTANAIAMYTKWSSEDPVDEWEMSVNNAIHNSSKYHNRNPFVDHPEWVNTLWGGTEYSGDNPIVPTVTMSISSKTINVGESFSINAVSSANSAITWSKDSSYVNLSTTSSTSGTDITVTGVSEGVATIYASSTIEGKTYKDTCVVTVTNSTGDDIGDDDTPVTGTYTIVPADLTSGSYETSDTEHCTSGSDIMYFYTKNCSNFNSKIQMKANAGYLYSKDALNLSSIKINDASGPVTVYGGTSKNPSSTTIALSDGKYDLKGYTYFKIAAGSKAFYASSIEVNIGGQEDSISLDKTSLSIEEGSSDTITAISSGTVTWNSSNTSVATLSISGNVATVTAISEGTSTITATCGTKTATCLATVTPKENQETGCATIVATDLASKYEEEATLHTSANGSFGFCTSNCANYGNGIQFKKSIGILYSADECDLKSLTINTPTGGTLTVYGSNTIATMSKAITENNNKYDLTGYKYFYIKSGSSASYCESIAIEYTPSTPETIDPNKIIATINYGNCNIQTSTGSSVLYKSYTYDTNKTLAVKWGSGCYKNTSYSEISFVNTNGYLKSDDKTFVKSITIDMFYQSSYTDTYSVYADGELISGQIGTSTSNSNSKVYTYTINSSDWEIRNETGYARHFYSFDFEIDLTKTFAGNFLAEITCDNGETQPDITAWSRMATSFNNLNNDAKAEIKNATANQSGSLIEQCVARYDYIIVKYGTSKYSDFMLRSPAGFNPTIRHLHDDDTLLASVVVIALTSTMTIGLICVNKKKEQR